MTIIINTNVAAMNAERNLSMTNDKMNHTLEQMSSGLRINRAADDAAGLAISERMKSQINGLTQGLNNAQDGISMVQTAEGALAEETSILQRLRELTVQAGNSTLSSTDRVAIGEEMTALLSQMDNIAGKTTFNGLHLLNGSLAVTDAGTGTANAVTATANSANVTVSSIDVGHAMGGTTYTLSASGTNLTLSETTGSVTQSETIAVGAMGQNATQALSFSHLGVTINLSHDNTAGNVGAAAIATAFDTTTIDTAATGAATWRVGDQVGDDISMSFIDMSSSALGNGGGNDLATLISSNAAVSTATKADTLLQAIDSAISQVSTFRAQLGASQNQLASAVTSGGVTVQNMTAAQSQLADADIAKVSSQMVTQQIMQQAGISVLAQANSAPQAVLTLLKNG